MGRTSRISKKPDINTQKIIVNMLKAIMIGYIITILCVLLLSFIVYKYDPSNSQINIGRVVIIILATIIMGLLIGRGIGKNKWMYGAIAGVIYFVIFVIASIIINKNSGISGDAISLFFMCVGGSTLGGMLG
ncbi:TIGR04086 family membrane protein [Vallitalea sp.]|jgi:putative membrane protein (TIGR04086 family)|uniref:TIGR04086 family membrane protein n=1 Tax=Vallitalea sp. TaxID=1882829 RepID=UPI0025E6E599|nr:TIGR04086 family membrane protein [Vallitalea sp.]MCT4687588.1 TIGR04086 family membrane protein [Vallitalea sp.]